METIIEKLEEYEIVISLIPGYFFLWLLKHYVGIDMPLENVLQETIAAYVTGVVIGRIGSIVISKFLRTLKFIEFANYKDYVMASKNDSRIQTLLMNANFYRNILSTVSLIFVLKIATALGINLEILKHIVLAIVLIIFLLAFRKEERNITGRVNISKTSSEEKKVNVVLEMV